MDNTISDVIIAEVEHGDADTPFTHREKYLAWRIGTLEAILRGNAARMGYSQVEMNAALERIALFRTTH